jgi:hypothetical protein
MLQVHRCAFDVIDEAEAADPKSILAFANGNVFEFRYIVLP